MKGPHLPLMILILLAGWAPAWAQAPAVRLRSDGTVAGKIPIAVPDFGGAAGVEAVAREMTQVIRFDLAFTGLFDLLPQDQFPAEFAGFTQDAAQIDFSAWRATNAEHLVYAFVTLEDANLKAQCRLFDTLTGTQVVGQLLTTDRDYPRLLAHRFAEEIVRFLDGVPGIASSQVCFSAGAPGKKEVYVADYDGANATQVTRHGSISIKPKFSPDGRMIAYLSYKDRYPFLYIFNRTTGKSTPFSRNVGLNAAPAWAPDARTLALVLSKDGNTEVYLKNVDGSGSKRLTNNRASDTSPTFSPDGRQIAFVSDRSGRPQVFAMSVDGTSVRRLSYQGGSSYDPAWSPDGKSIAYVAEKPGDGLEIYVMDAADGKNWRRLTNCQGGNESPSWSPDSRHIIFASTRSGRSELWAVTVETGEEYRLSSMAASCQGPYWGPRRG